MTLRHVAACLALCGCLPTKAPSSRAVARGAVLATAEAVKAADEACARVGADLRDGELLARCEGHYTTARAALMGTATALDLWDSVTNHEPLACSLVRATRELEAVRQELDARGRPSPPVVADALALVAALGRCHDGGT